MLCCALNPEPGSHKCDGQCRAGQDGMGHPWHWNGQEQGIETDTRLATDPSAYPGLQPLYQHILRAQAHAGPSTAN
jgi:hypothetical protein